MPARYVCWLWIIVIARFLLPVSAASVVAISSVADAPIQSLFSSNGEIETASDGFDIFTYEDDEGKPVSVAILPDDATTEQRAKADAYVAKITAKEKALLASQAPSTRVNEAKTGEYLFEKMEPFLIALSVLLVFGLPAIAIALLLRGIASHLRFAWKLRFMPAICDQATVDCLLRVCDDLGVGRRAKLKEVASLGAPAVFGLLRPVICLPAGWREGLTMEQLDWVFRHEMAHVKSRDGLVLFVANIARSLHWFNPLSWIAVAKLQQNMERAADEAATRNLSEASIRDYGSLLLEYAAGQTTSRQRATVGLLAMALPRGLSGRIESLAISRSKRRWLTRFAMLPLVMIIAASGLTDAKTIKQFDETPRSVPNFNVAIAGTDWRRPNSTIADHIPPRDVRSVSINVENALRKARELQPGVDAEKFVMGYFAMYPMTAEQREETTIVDGVMTLMATPQQESLVRQMLSGFEQSGPWQVTPELRVFGTDIRSLNQFDWSVSDSTPRCRHLDRSPLLDDSEGWEATFSIDASSWPLYDMSSAEMEHVTSIPFRAIRISRLQSERLLRQVQGDPRSKLMQAPTVSMFNGQCGMISDLVQRPFVTDVIEIPGNKATALEPKISVFEDGWKFLMKTTVTNDEKVNLQLVLSHSSVNGVKLAKLPHFAGNAQDSEVTIQVPSVQSNSIAVESVLGADEALLIFSPKPYSSEEDEKGSASNCGMGQVFMIRTRLISDSDVLRSFVANEATDSKAE